MQKDLLKDSQRQLQDTRQVAVGVDEQLRAATRERDALLSSRRSRGARTGPMRGRADRWLDARAGASRVSGGELRANFLMNTTTAFVLRLLE